MQHPWDMVCKDCT